MVRLALEVPRLALCMNPTGLTLRHRPTGFGVRERGISTCDKHGLSLATSARFRPGAADAQLACSIVSDPDESDYQDD